MPGIPHFSCHYRSALLLSACLAPFVCPHSCNEEKVPFWSLSTPEGAWFLAQRLSPFSASLLLGCCICRVSVGEAGALPCAESFPGRAGLAKEMDDFRFACAHPPFPPVASLLFI